MQTAEEGALQPGHRAPTHLRKRRERADQGKPGVKRRGATWPGRLRKRWSKQGGPGQEITRCRWYLSSEVFNTGPGSTKPVIDKYMVNAVEPQVTCGCRVEQGRRYD